MFDNICKFLVENFPGNFATWCLTVEQVQQLQLESQTTQAENP